MKRKANLDLVLSILVVVLSLLALTLVVLATYQFKDTVPVYRGF